MSLSKMILPRNWFLLAVAAALGSWLLLVRPPTATERPVAPLFPDFAAAEVTRIRIESPMDDGGEPEVTTLTRDGAGEPWTVAELYGAPGNPNRIDSLLSWIGTMTDLDIVSSGASPAAEYGLAPGQAVKVTLGSGSGASIEAGAGDPSFFAAPAEGGGAFVRCGDDLRVARVPRFPVQARGHLSWFDRDSLVPLAANQIRKVVATGTALAAPVTVTLPKGIMNRFIDGSGNQLEPAAALELFRSLRATFPDGVIELPPPGTDLALDLEITPAVGNPFRVSIVDVGESKEGGNERPGIAFQPERSYGVTVNPLAVQNILRALQAVVFVDK